jgi:hypothetical protein
MEISMPYLYPDFGHPDGIGEHHGILFAMIIFTQILDIKRV